MAELVFLLEKSGQCAGSLRACMRAFVHTVLLLCVVALPARVLGGPSAMAPLDDVAMGHVHAQGLFWSEKISGSELAGSSGYSTPFNFYRMGIDGELAVNANIGKLQLGCGGVNDFLNAQAGCDMDIDYVSLMGRSASNPGNPMSAFRLSRPYLELAVKNDGTANREIVGIKIGAQSADGALSAGRRYESAGAVNQENTMGWSEPGAWDTQPVRVAGANCQPGDSSGPGAVGCHSGINSVSGFLGAEMSLSMRVQACIRVIFCINIDAWGCAGRTQLASDGCSTAKADALFTDIGGTRMQALGLRGALLTLNDGGILTDLIGSAYASLNADLRLVHKLTFDNGGDFAISWQREPVAYPRFSKMTPTAEMQANGTYGSALDACATAYAATARCGSAYSVPANTGWWLNAPSVKLLDIVNPSADLGEKTVIDAIALLGAPGLLLNNAEFNMTPSKNCYGATRFC